MKRYAIVILVACSFRSCALTESEKVAIVEAVKHTYSVNQKKLNIIQFIVLKLGQQEAEMRMLKKRVEELEIKLAAKDLSL